MQTTVTAASNAEFTLTWKTDGTTFELTGTLDEVHINVEENEPEIELDFWNQPAILKRWEIPKTMHLHGKKDIVNGQGWLLRVKDKK